MSIELTDDDVEKFAATARRTLTQSIGQIAQLRKGFPSITDADIQAMSERIEADPDTGSRQESINVATYYIALHALVCANAQAAIAELGTSGTPATLHYLLLLLLPNCANIVNALTLLTRGGLATDLHIEEAGSIARSTVARSGATARHAAMTEAKLWVQQQWQDHAGRHEHNKTKFARHYVEQVKAQFELEVEEKTIRESWLSPSSLS